MKSPFPYSIFPLGDSALTLDFGNTIDTRLNNHVLGLFHHFKKIIIPGVSDIVPAYSSLSFHYDVLAVRHAKPGNLTAFEIIKELIEKGLQEDLANETRQQRKISIPVCYTSSFAPDIQFIASEKNISIEQIIQLHTDQLYTVYMIGFLPGFAYMGEVNEAISVPRKAQPVNVAAGAVGIAGRQTGIYPLDSPGGWQVIGRTPLKLFDKEKSDPVLLQPGDEIQFYSITEDEFENY